MEKVRFVFLVVGWTRCGSGGGDLYRLAEIRLALEAHVAVIEVENGPVGLEKIIASKAVLRHVDHGRYRLRIRRWRRRMSRYLSMPVVAIFIKGSPHFAGIKILDCVIPVLVSRQRIIEDLGVP